MQSFERIASLFSISHKLRDEEGTKFFWKNLVPLYQNSIINDRLIGIRH